MTRCPLLCSVPLMNRILLCVALIVVFACVQGMSLHGHHAQASDSHSTMADYETIHLHSHTVSTDIDRDHEHSEAVEVDLLGTVLARDPATPTTHFAMAVWALILIVLWVCIRRSPPPVPLVHFGPPPVLSPSPRAPPR